MPGPYPPKEPCKDPNAFIYREITPSMMAAVVATGISENQALAAFTSLINQTFELMEEGQKVAWPNFGTWFKRRYAGRNRRNPRTGATIICPAYYMYTFRRNWRWRA